MAKKIIEKKVIKEKPQEILELEKAWGIVLSEREADFRISGGLHPHTYSLNYYGKVNGLSIPNNNIKEISLITKFKNLEFLILGRNSIEDISPLSQISNLKYLFLGGNRIKDLSPLKSCEKLLALAIWNNPIEDINIVSQFKYLEGLYCQNTKKSNISFIKNLKELRIFYADENEIESESADLLLCSNNLTSVSLTDNRLKNITIEIAKKFNWLANSMEEYPDIDQTGLFLFNNPLEFPPPSVIELGPETVKNYYETAEQFGHAPLSEGRIIFVGDGSSGKSSIIEKTLYNTFEKGREQTNGISIEKLHLPHPEDQRDLTFHIWDFGGQEIQHAVHKFFFTEGCLYVLVLDNRKEEEPEYWLQQIESLGGRSPVMVIFNKQDENAAETVDRKYLKEKYPNITGFYNTSCLSGFGIDDFKKDLELQVTRLKTVNEQFPTNWFDIKKAIENHTSGAQHYLNYDSYQEICKQHHIEQEEAQKLLLKYFTTIGAVTWFGDTYLNFLHVLNPAWITQGVYKIITAKKTANLFGQINITDFKELLQPANAEDYTYEEKHYGYILSMMKKFDLCYTPDDKNLLIPSAFGKAPKIEYSEFRGEGVRTYILQFKDYMPLALIHRYIAKELPKAFENNCWYSGIVIKDCVSDTLAMVHADKEAKRIYIRIKGDSSLGVWEHIRREFNIITSSYANIKYRELVALDEKAESTVDYEDLISHIQAKKSIYFHPKLKQDFNVGYLMGLFESKEDSIQKMEKGEISIRENDFERAKKLPPFVINILNNNSPTVNAQIDAHINIDIDIQVVNNISSELKGDARYLQELLDNQNVQLNDALLKIMQFADDAKTARNSGDVIEKGWARKLKGVLQTLGNTGEQLRNIQDGSDVMKNIFKSIRELANQFSMSDIVEFVNNMIS